MHIATAANSLAMTENDAYYCSHNKLWQYNIKDKKRTEIVSEGFVSPTSVAYGGREIWVADNGSSYVYRFDAGDKEETAEDGWLAIQGIWGIHLVNTEEETFAASLVILLGLLFA